MHGNKIRPFVRRALFVQMREGVIDNMPGFSVTRAKRREPGDGNAYGVGFEVKIKGYMREDSGFGVDAVRLKTELMNKFPHTNFCVLVPF